MAALLADSQPAQKLNQRGQRTPAQPGGRQLTVRHRKMQSRIEDSYRLPSSSAALHEKSATCGQRCLRAGELQDGWEGMQYSCQCRSRISGLSVFVQVSCPALASGICSPSRRRRSRRQCCCPWPRQCPRSGCRARACLQTRQGHAMRLRINISCGCGKGSHAQGVLLVRTGAGDCDLTGQPAGSPTSPPAKSR
jgi:hypothetical protein